MIIKKNLEGGGVSIGSGRSSGKGEGVPSFGVTSFETKLEATVCVLAELGLLEFKFSLEGGGGI